MAMRIQHALKVVVALAMGLIPTVAHGVLNKKFGKHYHFSAQFVAWPMSG